MLKKSLLAAAVLAGLSTAEAAKEKNITLVPLGTFETGVFDEGAAEIVAHDPGTQQLFVINADAKTVDMLDISDPTTPTLNGVIDVSIAIPASGGVNSVAVHEGLVAVAVEHDDAQANGWVAFYDTAGNYLAHYGAGALPDAVAFTHNGSFALVANEGEPSGDYQTDPEGSVTIVDLRAGVLAATISHATFTKFNDAPPAGVRLPRPYGATVAQDLEPEFITTAKDSKTAWVSLQENNAVAEIDIASAEVTALWGLGRKDHLLPGNELDPSDDDDGIHIANWPVLGVYMPDGIHAYQAGGVEYLLTANEGDAREYFFDATEEDCEGQGLDWDEDDGCLAYEDLARGDDLDLDPAVFVGWPDLQEDEELGRLRVVTTEGDIDGDDVYEEIHAFGGRSFSIWDTAGNQVFDSGSEFEDVTATLLGEDGFNFDNTENDSFESRSDDKGPEPEYVITGQAFGRQYAFIGLERVSGIMIYDVTVPADSRYVSFVSNRDFLAANVGGDLEGVDAGDLGPEGLAFIKAEDSPNGAPLLVVGNEVSGSTTIWQVVRD